MKKTNGLIFVLLFTLTAALLAADEKGDAVMKKSYALPESQTESSNAVMVIVSPDGDKKIRKIRMVSRKQIKAGTRLWNSSNRPMCPAPGFSPSATRQAMTISGFICRHSAKSVK